MVLCFMLVPKVRIGGAEPYPTYKLEALTYLIKRHLAIVAKLRDYRKTIFMDLYSAWGCTNLQKLRACTTCYQISLESSYCSS